MERNSDIKLYVASSIIQPSKTAQMMEDLVKLGYVLAKQQKDAQYLIIDDSCKDMFDINYYRAQLKIALDNDQAIVFLSNGIPFFMKYDDGTYFTKLYVDCYRSFVNGTPKFELEYHTENPPGHVSDIRPSVFIPGFEPDDINVMKWETYYPPQRDRDISCYRKWKGLYY